jgi:hypothetical protein
MRHLLLAAILLAIISLFTFSSFKNVSASIFSVTVNPEADSYVEAASPTRNNGTSTQVRIDGSPVVRTYIKFNVTGVTGTVSSATLEIYANSAQSTGFEVHKVQDTSWTETSVNYNNAPSYDGEVLGTSGPLKAATWYSVDVAPAISGNGSYSFLLLTAGSTAASLASRESGNSPHLDIVYSDGSGSTATPIATPTAVPSTIPTATATPVATPTATPLVTLTPTPQGSDPIVMAASDIICDSLSTSSSSCQQMAASQVAVNENPDALLIVGDLCHTPSSNCFNNYYAPSWGRLFAKTYPITGNHEYLVSKAVPYFDYWNGVGNANGRAGERTKGYYSFDIGAWHIIALNSQCSQAGGCNAGSPQYTWLQQDLASHPNSCTLAYYHIPVFSSGGRANNNMKQIYTLLYNNNVEVVLDGHDHIYERFAPQDPNGQADPVRGIRQFIVGTGGANHTKIASVKPNSEVRNTDTFGALKLTLRENSYDWEFKPVAGKTFTDSGTSLCH